VIVVLDSAPSAPGPNDLPKDESREMDLDLGPGVDTRHEGTQVFHSNANKDADTSLDESKVWTNVFKHCFRRVVCDEGHKLKNSRTRNHRAVFKTFAPCVWILSATPMLNSVVDMLGYLNLFWQADWELNEEDMPGSLVDLYSDTFRRDHRQQVPQYGSRFPQGYRNLDFFILHPKHFATLHNRGHLQGTVAYNVLRPILALLQMRLGVAHQMDVNGRNVRVGDKIPMYRITTVELKMGAFEEKQYRTMWESWSLLLSRRLNSSGGQFQ
jgi:SNF2-related domain